MQLYQSSDLHLRTRHRYYVEISFILAFLITWGMCYKNLNFKTSQSGVGGCTYYRMAAEII